MPTQTNPQFARGAIEATGPTHTWRPLCTRSRVFNRADDAHPPRRSKPIFWSESASSTTAKWSSRSSSRTWLPPDSARIRKVSRSNETKLIQSHYRELTGLRAVTAHQDLLSSPSSAGKKDEAKGRGGGKERGRRGWKSFRHHRSTLHSRDGQGFKEVHVPLLFIFLKDKPSRGNVLSSTHRLVSPSSYVLTPAECD